MDIKQLKILILWVAVSGVVAAEEYHNDCMLDHDGSNTVLEECLQKGERFVKEYMKVLRRDNLEQFGTCQNFHPFGDCITDLWKRCPTVQQVTYKHWKPIVDLLTNACNKTYTQYVQHHEHQCLEVEMSGVLVHRCDELYEFNIKQKTRDRCVFLKEAIYCKTALVNTSCGTEVGQVAYSLAKINAKKLIQKSRCYVTMEDPYNGFRYTEQCPRDFKDDMKDCYEEHIKPTELKFHKDNDLIVEGTKKQFREACGGWRKYRMCVREIKDCKQGVDAVLEQNGKLRTYLLKMEYLCKEEKEVYLDNLPCLQEILANHSLDVCKRYWDELKPWLNQVSSYQYYCVAHNINTQGLQEGLENLRLCYERTFSTRCGSNVGSVMSELIRRAFYDPYYLRFGYEANCAFHKQPSSKKRSKPHFRDSPDHYDIQRNSPGGKSITNHGGGRASPDMSSNKDLVLHNTPHSQEYFDYTTSVASCHHTQSSYQLVASVFLFILQTVVRQMLFVQR